jgi:hypothetical protein
MTTKIVVAGATGNLGTRIVRALRARGADVVALARTSSKEEKVHALRALGAEVAVVDMSSAAAIAEAIGGAACLVSAVQGLREVIVDGQGVLLDAALAAGVPRFIPSDFSTDFTKLAEGDNRNFDLRRAFHARLDQAKIRATAIFNGAFAEILTYNVPALDLKAQTVGYWDDADWSMDFTTMDDVAAYTAAAAFDSDAPAQLRIASFQVSPRQLSEVAGKIFHRPFPLVEKGTRAELRAYNDRERAAHPEGETEIFPRWQQSQYLHSMFSTHHESLDNERYPGLVWTNLEAVLAPLARR